MERMRIILLFAAALVLGLQLRASDLFSISEFTQIAGQPAVSFGSATSDSIGTSDTLSFSNGYIAGLTDDLIGSSNTYSRNPGLEISLFTDNYAVSMLKFNMNAAAEETLRTPGPKRPGIIAYQLSLTGGSFYGRSSGYATDVTGLSSVGISDGIHTYGQAGCQSVCDSAVIYAPFELGTVFSTVSYADESGYAQTPTGYLNNGAGISFSLFEADGITPVPLQETSAGTTPVPVNLAPEPSTVVSCGFAFALSFLGFGKNGRRPALLHGLSSSRRLMRPW